MKRYFSFLLVAFSLNGFSVFVEGQPFTLEVDPEDTFASVQELLAEYFAFPEEEQAFFVAKNEAVARKATSKPRNFDASVTSKEKKDIAYIVSTLAEKSLFSLLGYKSSLEEAGDRVNHVHPLRFLMCIFTDSHLKNDMKDLQKRGGWVWGDFMGGLSNSLSEEHKRNNVTDEQVKNFAKAVGVDPSHLLPSVHKKKWSDFVGALIKQSN